MPEFALEKIIGGVLGVVLIIIIAVILNALKVGGGFYYAGCEGEIHGNPCSGSVEGSHITIAGVCGKDVKTVAAIDNPKCTIFSSSDQCLILNYKNITRENQNLSVCLWVDEGHYIITGKNVTCLMNGELSCEDFSQSTTPKCQDVGCQPVTVLKKVIETIKPEKCTIGVGSTCLI